MPEWLTYRIDLVAGAAIGFAYLTVGAAIGFTYMEIQSQKLVERVTTTETRLADANAKAESLEAELAKLRANLRAELVEKDRLLDEQLARATTSRQVQPPDKDGGPLWQQHAAGYRWSRRPSPPALVEHRLVPEGPPQTLVEAKLAN